VFFEGCYLDFLLLSGSNLCHQLVSQLDDFALGGYQRIGVSRPFDLPALINHLHRKTVVVVGLSRVTWSDSPDDFILALNSKKLYMLHLRPQIVQLVVDFFVVLFVSRLEARLAFLSGLVHP